MNILADRPSAKEMKILFISLVVWIIVTTLFVGIRPEHGVMALLIAVFILFQSGNS